MPEFVACPACGFRAWAVESLLGKQVRCTSCGHHFLAADPEPPGEAERIPWPALPARPPEPDSPPRTLKPSPPGPPSPRARRPLCPRCNRGITWDVAACPFCGEEFEGEGGVSSVGLPPGPLFRRDCEPHRGNMLLALGNVSLTLGALSLCLFGTVAVLALPLGVVVWALARGDLARMDRGEVDPAGRRETENARTAAAVGIVLSLLFGFLYSLMYLSHLGL